MAKSMKNMVLLAAVQTAVDTDPLPTGAANAIQCRALMPKPISAEFVERNLTQGYKGNFGSLAVGVHREFEFEVELASSGTPGTAPAWGPLLKACGFSQTIVATTSVAYAPVSSGEPLLCLYGYIDGVLFKMLNSKGTVSFEMNPKSIPVMKFRFVGEYSIPTDAPLPSGTDYSKFIQPQTVGRLTTPTLSIHGVNACVSQFTFDIANSLVWRDLVNCGGAYSADRKPAGNVTMELTSVAVKNWAETVRTGAKGALQLVHGVGAGNIVQIDAPAVQFTGEPSLSDDNGVAMLAAGFSMQPVAGNDELVITLK
ncbi:phage tail tube protein [uncultured Xylophilus sp.]|uniref:phage tail tube protein n=1 Tax=uncultured Xylophilus sp. TaxID=296832 RepID=UPI0025D7C55A|nr:phage tail tube protein [uncultured Xylophilus sp.]